MNRKAMATALRGTKHEKTASRRRPASASCSGLKPFTPHDLRRTAATLAGDLGFDDAWIAKCLDHAASKKTASKIVPSVTGKVYNHSKRMKREARGAGRRRSRAAADHRRARRKPDCGSPPDQRQSRNLRDLSSPVSAKLAGLFLLKYRETRHLAADAFGVLPGVW